MWFGSDLIEKHKEEKQLNKKKLSFWRTHDLVIDILNLCVYLFVCLFVFMLVSLFFVLWLSTTGHLLWALAGARH